VRIGQGKAINNFNLRTKELGYNYWSTYTKSRIGGVQVISLYRDPIGVDNMSRTESGGTEMKDKRKKLHSIPE